MLKKRIDEENDAHKKLYDMFYHITNGKPVVLFRDVFDLKAIFTIMNQLSLLLYYYKDNIDQNLFILYFSPSINGSLPTIVVAFATTIVY